MAEGKDEKRAGGGKKVRSKSSSSGSSSSGSRSSSGSSRSGSTSSGSSSGSSGSSSRSSASSRRASPKRGDDARRRADESRGRTAAAGGVMTGGSIRAGGAARGPHGRRSPSRSPPRRRQRSPSPGYRRQRSPPARRRDMSPPRGRGGRSPPAKMSRRSRSPRSPLQRRRSPTPAQEEGEQGRKRLLIKNLSRNITKQHLKEIFNTYGATIEADVIPDSIHTNINSGKAYVDYEKEEDAEKAAKHFDGGQIDGKEVECEVINIPSSRSRPMGAYGRSPPRDDRRRQASPPRQRYRSPVGDRRGGRVSGANSVPIGGEPRRGGSRSPRR